jgi:hypothetical protein
MGFCHNLAATEHNTVTQEDETTAHAQDIRK